MTTSLATRWIDRWNAYWFPATPLFYLSVSRIVAVAAQLFWFPPSLSYQINLLEKNSEFIDPQPLIRLISAIVPREAFFTPGVFTAIYWATAAAGLLALIGFFTRTSVFLFALGTWISISHGYSYADIHHPEAVFAIFLMLLAFSPSGGVLSVDALLRRRRNGSTGDPSGASATSDLAIWPLKLAHVVLAMTYFSTGISKLLSGGLTWMNGYTLQTYAFSDAIRRDIPLGIWLGQQHSLCLLLSIFTVFFELFFFVSLILPRTAPFFFINGILFQIGLFVTAGHPFFGHIVLLALLLVFVSPEWWRARSSEAQLSRWHREEQAHQAS